ncbi:hypothetical protein STENM223S_02967 [Streptomyces tendae]
MGIGLYVLQRTAKSLPHLFQAMGLLLYATQILLLFVFLAVFKNTTLFHPKAFAITLVAGTLAWIAAQTRAHMEVKDLRRTRVDEGHEVREIGALVVTGRAGIKRHAQPCYRPVPTAASRARASQLTPAQSRGEMPPSRPHIRYTSPVPNRG